MYSYEDVLDGIAKMEDGTWKVGRKWEITGIMLLERMGQPQNRDGYSVWREPTGKG